MINSLNFWSHQIKSSYLVRPNLGYMPKEGPKGFQKQLLTHSFNYDIITLINFVFVTFFLRHLIYLWFPDGEKG